MRMELFGFSLFLPIFLFFLSPSLFVFFGCSLFLSSIYSHARPKKHAQAVRLWAKTKFLNWNVRIILHAIIFFKPVCNSAYLLKSSNKKQQPSWMASPCVGLSISFNATNCKYVCAFLLVFSDLVIIITILWNA